MIKNPSGRMVPRNLVPNANSQSQARPARRGGPSGNLKLSNSQNKQANTNKAIIPKNIIGYPVAEYISALVIKKRNVYLESQNYSGIESQDVYEIVSLNNNPKNGLVEYLNYKPIANENWKPITKYLKKIQYNVSYKIENCEVIQQTNL
jgi:hypothetical protein